MDLDDFLLDISPSFSRFSNSFKEEGFVDIKSLKCIHLPEDLDSILKNDSLKLGEKRQLEHAIKTLQKVDESTIVKTSEVSGKIVQPALDKILNKNTSKLEKKKKELLDLEKLIKKMCKQVPEPLPCGSRSVRCSNCHVLGHKAEGNTGGKPCPNPQCTNYFRCGQEKFHADYRLEKKQVEEELKLVKKDIKNLELENDTVISYSNSAHSFNALMRHRLKATNPHKYSNSASLMKDLITLKKHYQNNVPSTEQNDKRVFSDILTNFDNVCNKLYSKESKNSDDSDDDFVGPPKKTKRGCFMPNPTQDMFQGMYHPFNYGLPVNPFSFGFPQMQQMQQMHHPSMFSNICPPVKQLVSVTSTVTSPTDTSVTSQSQLDMQTHSGHDHLNLLADAASTYANTELNSSETDNEDE